LISAYLGELDIDLRGLQVGQANFGTGIGDIRIVASELPPVAEEVEGESEEARILGGIRAYSTFGDVTLVIPLETQAIVKIAAKPMARLHIDESRFLMLEPGVYATLGYEQSAAPIRAEIGSTFGAIRVL